MYKSNFELIFYGENFSNVINTPTKNCLKLKSLSITKQI